MDRGIDPTDTQRVAVIEFPMIELAGDDLDSVRHPFDAAERVLAAVS